MGLIEKIHRLARPSERLLNPAPPIEGRHLNILLDTTSACNMTCRMCWQSLPMAEGASKKPDVLSVPALERIVHDIIPRTASVNFSCIAEPFMNRKFGDFLDLFNGTEIHQSSIVTNGTILPEEMLEKIVRAGITRLTFSIDSANKENFEHIRRGGDFERIIGNIRKLQAWKAARNTDIPSVQINCILMKDNIGGLIQVIELAKDLGADELNIRHVIPIDGLEMQKQSLFDQQRMADRTVLAGSKRAKQIGLYMPTVPLFDEGLREGSEGLVSRLASYAKRSIKKYIQVNWMKPRCRQPWENLSIHPNGDVYPCNNWTYDPSTHGASMLFPAQGGTTSVAEDYRMGNLNEQDFAEIWNGPKFVELRKSLLGETPMKDACVKCPLRLGQGNETYSPKTDVVERLRFWSRSENVPVQPTPTATAKN